MLHDVIKANTTAAYVLPRSDDTGQSGGAELNGGGAAIGRTKQIKAPPDDGRSLRVARLAIATGYAYSRS